MQICREWVRVTETRLGTTYGDFDSGLIVGTVIRKGGLQQFPSCFW